MLINLKKSKENFEEENKKTESKIHSTLQEFKRKIIKKISIFIFLLFLLIGGIIALMLSPIFNIKGVEVRNNGLFTKEQIILMSDIPLNENIFKFSKNKVKNNLLSNSYIENVVIKTDVFSKKVILEVEVGREIEINYNILTSIQPTGAESSNTNIAEVTDFIWGQEEKVVVLGKSVGITTISLISQSGTLETVKVKVVAKVIKIDECIVSPTQIELYVGEKQQISVTSTESGTIEPLTYSTSDSSIATVNVSGKITAVGVGTTTIIITGGSSGKTAVVNVYVVPVTGIYGQYVDIGTNLIDKTIQYQDGDCPLADWRIFDIDENGMWVILSGYLPISNMPTITNLNKGSNQVYNVNASSRANLVSAINNTSEWKVLLNGTSLRNNDDVIVKGSPDVLLWVKSWNQNASYTHLYTPTKSVSDGTAYYIGNSSSATSSNYSLKKDTGYINTLYFPYNALLSNCDAYWLGSLSTKSGGTIRVYGAGGDIGGNNSGPRAGLRPVVYIPNTVSFNKSQAVWTIVN